MERDRVFNFKLMVPPRVNPGPISAVKPREIVDESGGFRNTPHQGYSKRFDKEVNLPFPSTNMVGPAKPRAEVSKTMFMPIAEKQETHQSSCEPGQLYSKLLDEVGKIKCWKVQVGSETMQKERKLQENKITIETQRKAIQELQFGNESLSIKLEEQIGDNEDLRNKNNATRNLCNILKDTFQRSADKIQLFESEREETHHLFIENSDNILRMTAAFESLRIQAESDRHEMQKVKESLPQIEDLREKFEEEFSMAQEEVVKLQMTMKEKEKELQEILLNLHKTQESCKQLKEAAKQHHEALQRTHQEQEFLLEKLQREEKLNRENEENIKAIASELELNKEETAQMIVKKDANIKELNKLKDVQAGQLTGIQATVEELQTSLTSEAERARQVELKLSSITEDLEKKSIALGEIKEQSEKKDRQIQIFEEELDVKSKSIQSLKEKINAVESRALEITSELVGKSDKVQQYKNQVEILTAENNLLEKACGKSEKSHNDLKEKSYMTEAKVQEMEEQLSVAMKNNETSTKEIEQLKGDIVQHEVKYEELLESFQELQLQKNTIQEQVESESSEAKTREAHLKESEARGMKISKEMETLVEENLQLREEMNSLNTKIVEQGQDSENLQKKFDESCGDLQSEITQKENRIQAMETKLSHLKTKLAAKTTSQAEYQKETKMLKRQIGKEIEKSCLLENEIHQLQEEAETFQRSNEEKCQELLGDAAAKSASEAELQKEVQTLKLKAAEAIKRKEDAEIKCQHKIADMVALMEKHKNQYDKMVEEKDAELDEKRRSKMEADSNRTSLELELSQIKIENDHLKEQLEKELTAREKLIQNITELKEEMASMKMNQQLHETQSKQLPASNTSSEVSSDTPKELSTKSHVFDFSKTQSQTLGRRLASTPIVKEIKLEDLKTPSYKSSVKVGATPRIKSYRVRTPPSTGKSVPWRSTTLELDPKSDSSEHTDLLSYSVAPPEPLLSTQNGTVSAIAPQRTKADVFKKIQSPAIYKSPGNALKLAAMKRMRDAGWTAVMRSNKKKKDTDKIFA